MGYVLEARNNFSVESLQKSLMKFLPSLGVEVIDINEPQIIKQKNQWKIYLLGKYSFGKISRKT